MYCVNRRCSKLSSTRRIVGSSSITDAKEQKRGVKHNIAFYNRKHYLNSISLFKQRGKA
jgi:hypothetical protein